MDWLPGAGAYVPTVFVGMHATTRYNVRVSKLRDYSSLNHPWPWTKWCDGTDRTGFLAPLGMTAFTKAFQHPVREASAEIER
jgi:hypothetical protein